MIDVGALLDPSRVLVGGGALGALVAARYLLRAYALAQALRTLAVLLALTAVGALAGVVDLARLWMLVRGLADVFAGAGAA